MKSINFIRRFSSSTETIQTTQRVRRFYKKVDVVPHPVMEMLQMSDLKSANFAVDSDT
jgi:hypothetical protein